MVAAPVAGKSLFKKPFSNRQPACRQAFEGTPAKGNDPGEADGATPSVLLKPKTPTAAIAQATMTKTRADYALPSTTLPPRQLPCMTGRLKHFQTNWRKITNHPWILQTILGCRISFIKRPWQARPRITRAKTLHQQNLLQNTVTELMNKEAIAIYTIYNSDNSDNNNNFNHLNPSQTCQRLNLRKKVLAPTRCSNTPDQLLTNMSKLYNKMQHLPPLGRSDHHCVLFTPLNQESQSKATTRSVRNLHPENIRALGLALNLENWEDI